MIMLSNHISQSLCLDILKIKELNLLLHLVHFEFYHKLVLHLHYHSDIKIYICTNGQTPFLIKVSILVLYRIPTIFVYFKNINYFLHTSLEYLLLLNYQINMLVLLLNCILINVLIVLYFLQFVIHHQLLALYHFF